jgi:plasmid stabilization system protein ParE
LTHPVRLSALAAADIQQARDWHDAKEPGLGDTFLKRVDEAIARISKNPFQYASVIADVRRANLKQFQFGVWYRIKTDGSVVVACLHHRRAESVAKRRAVNKLEA